MFLSNWLVFKIVLAAVTGLVDYPLAADVLLVYDNANKLYLSGGSLEYVSNVVLYKGETSYTLGMGDIINKTTTTAYEVVLPSGSGHGAFGINQDATRYVHQYPEANGYSNGKFQVYSGTPSDGYTEYGSPITPFDSNEVILCSMSADGKYILVTNYNGGFADGYKMYKDNGSGYVYHSSYACIGSSTNNDTGYTPAFVPSNNNFVITGTGGGSNSGDFYFKLYVYDPLTETWTGKTTVYSLNAPTGDAQRGLFGKSFTYDGKYLMMSDNGTPTRGEVYEVDWDANTMVNVWYTTEGNNGDGAGGAISPDNRYVVLCRHDGNPYRVYENTSGDWSTVVNVTSEFDLTGSGTSTVFGSYGIEFSGYSSENTTPLYIGQFAGYYGDGKFRLENWSKRSPYQIYITQPGTYRADLQICGIDYKTNEVEVTGTPSDIEVFTEPETDFTASKAVLSSTSSISYHQGGMSDNGEYYYYGQQVYKKDTGSFTYTTYGSALSSTIFSGSQSSISHDGNYIVSYYTNSTHQLHIIKNNGSTFTSHQIIASPNSSARSDSQPQFIPGPLKHFVWIEKVSGTSNITFHFYKYNSGTDTWSLGFSVTNPTDLSVGVRVYGRGGMSFSKDGNYLAISTGTGGTTETGVAVLKVDWVNETCVKKYENTSVGYWACFLSRDAKYFYYSTGTGTTAGKMLYSANGDWEGTPTDVTSSFTNIGNLGDHTSVFSGRYIFSEKGGSARYIFKWNDLISPTLTFDNYNKLSLTNTPTYTSSKLSYGSNVYDIGTLMSDITIEKQGEYASLTFDTSSNVAYFSNVTVGAIASTMAGYEADTIIYGTVQSGASHGTSQGGFGNNAILNADGTRLLVTDPLNYPSGRGRAYIYHLESGSWVLKQTWNNPNNSGQRFADGVCMNEDGTRVFLMHSGSEKVYTYEYASGAWPTANTGTHTISPGTIGGEYEGMACNKAGDVLLIGQGNVNTAKIYRRASATSWSQDSGGSFSKGRGVAMNGAGTRAFIGNSADGTVHMTEWNGITWSSLTQIIDESYSSWPCTMMSDSAGETLVIKSGTSSGHADSGIYERDSGTGSWSRAQGVNGHTEIYGMRLPSISYDGTMVLVGQYRYDNDKGRAQLWQKSGGSWSLTKEYLNPKASPATDDYWGGGTGIARTTKDKFVISMEGDDTAGTEYGSVHIYTNAIPDFISFDTYNKLSLSGITNPTSKIHALPTGADSTTTYDIGSATNIYIESEGTYTAEMKGSSAFALDSNVTGTVNSPPTYEYIGFGGMTDLNNGYTTTYNYLLKLTKADGTPLLYSDIETFTILMDNGNGTNLDFTNIFQDTKDAIAAAAGQTSTGWHGNGKVEVTALADGTALSDHATNTYIAFYFKLNEPTTIIDGASLTLHRSDKGQWKNAKAFGTNTNPSTFSSPHTPTDWTELTEVTTVDAPLGSYNGGSNPSEPWTSLGATQDFNASAPGRHLSLTFDGYNKYTFTGADTGSTYKLKYESNTYDLGTISNVYIAHPGTYSAEIKGATNFALSSNVTGNLGTYLTLHDNVAISHTTGGGQTLVTVNNIKGNKTYKISFNKQWTDSHASYSTRLKMYIKDSSDGSIRNINSIGDYLNSPRDGILLYDAGGAFDESAMIVGTGFSVDGGAGTHTVEITGGTYGSTSSPFTLADPWYFLITMSTSDVITGKFFVGDTEVISHFLTRKQSGDTGTIGETGNKFVFEFHSTATISGVNMTVEEYNPAPKLDFDGYNKLTFTGLESGSTSNVTFDGNTYSIGTASNVYIENTGTYEVESKGTSTFALTSKAATVDTTIIEFAFHYEAFNSSYYSGKYSSASAAATAGVVYSDTATSTTYSWGTLNSIDTSTSGQVGYSLTLSSAMTANVLIVGGGGGGGAGISGNWPSAGGGGEVQNLSNQTISAGTYTIVVGNGGTAGGGGAGGAGTTSSALGTSAVGGGAGSVGTSGTSGSGNGPGSNNGAQMAGGGGDASVGGNASGSRGGSGGDGSNVSWLDGSVYGEQVSGQAYFGGGGFGGDAGGPVAGKGNGVPGTGGGGNYSGAGKSGIVAIRSGPSATLPSLTHDGYKLVVKNITPTSSTLKYESNTYEIGSATNIYVENTGDYSAEIGGAADFALTSNTVSGTIKTIEPTLSGGNAYLHALSYDGKLYAWGINDDGELGLGDNTNRTTPTLYSGPLVSKILNKGWSGGNTRNETSWIKTVGNEVYATGKGDTYMIPGTTSDLLSFTDVTSYFGDQSLTSNNVVFVGGGERSCVSLTESGNVWTWGAHNSTYWNLGQGTGASSSNTPKQITFGGVTDNISRVAFGHDHGVALDTDGDVWFWGQIWAGGAGVDYPQTTLSDAQKSPHEIMTSNNIVGVSSTFFTIYAWQSDGTYYALGQDSHGQIGDGAASGGYTSWQKVEYFSANNITINEIYTGQYNVFADTSDGYYYWGYGASGAFGNGGTGNLASPTKWTNVSNIKLFSAGGSYMGAAITEDGKYYAWGSGSQKQRGDNDTGNITYPKYIDTLPNILTPSFEFDGYDKVFVGGTFVYEFYVSVKAAGSSGLHYVNINQLSSSTMTLKSNMVTVHVPSSGSAADMFDGSNSTYISINDPNHEVGTKLWTLVTDKELADLTFVADRPVYMPGWKITCNGKIVLNDTTNGSTSTTPSPATFTKTLSPITSLTKYTKGTTTYDVGKASIITVPDTGTYDAQLKKSGVFSLKSETVPATSSTGLYTWAFHHGNFDNAYGDGDILTARDNGRFYADTPAYTGDIGTITPVNPLVSSNVSFRLNEYTQNDSSDTNTTGIMLTEIDVFDDTNTAMTYGTDYRADLYRAAYADNSGDGGSGKLSDETTPYNEDGSRLNDDVLHGSGGYIGWVNGTYNASATGINRKYPYSVDDELIRLVPLTGKIIGKVQFAYKGTGTTPGWKVYRGTTLVETTNYAGTDINTQGNQTTHQIADTVSSTTYTFTPASTLTANVLMVAGGGGGGQTSGGSAGGGGAGGLLYYANQSITIGTKTIVVGNGGANHVNGNDTTFTLLTTTFGGGRGATAGETGGNGGSGGGTSHHYPTSPGTGVSDQGNAGGNAGNNTYRTGGGGGGAGGVGGNASTSSQLGGVGGIGLNYSSTFGSFYGESGWFAGGGAGCSQSTATPAVGGTGGGGYSSTAVATANALSGQSHTGGGGGGAGGKGGSGIVLLQTNVATPNANSEVKIPEPHCHVLIEKPDDTQFSHLPSLGNNNVHASGSIVPNIPRADGSVSNVYYSTSTGYFVAAQAGSLVSTVEGIFYPIQQERYDNILEIGHNSTNDVELEMAADGTAKLYRNNGGNELASGTVKCFTAGKWHHIALTLDTNRNAVAYVNGYPVVSTTYASAKLPLDREQMCLYRTGVTATFRKFLMYYFKTYNSVLNHKQILKLAGAAGLGPKLEYDGLNTIKILNTEPGSGTEITIYESNVNDTSNLYVVSCNESSYLLSNAGTYYAQIKGTDTFTITRPLTVTDDHFPLYQYPPIDGTTTGLTSSTTSATWTISGVQYSTESSVAGSPYNTFDNSITSGFDSTSSTGDITITFQSAKTIRKYIIWPYDSTSPVSTPGGNTDPTLSTDGTFRPKSWTVYGTNNLNDWSTVLDTVTNQPPSIYGDVHSISSPASYQYYKLSVTANNGGSGLKIGEWQLWGDA